MTGKSTTLCRKLGVSNNAKMNQILAELEAIGISIPEGNHPSFVLTRAMIKEAAQRLFSISDIASLKLAARRARLIELLDQEGVRLTPWQWNQAALCNSDLFCETPEALWNNLVGVIEQAKRYDIQISLGSYLAAALRQPALFSREPEKVVTNLSIIQSFQRERLFRLPDQPENSAIAKEWLISYLMRHPSVLAENECRLQLWGTWQSLNRNSGDPPVTVQDFYKLDCPPNRQKREKPGVKKRTKPFTKIGKDGENIDEGKAPALTDRILSHVQTIGLNLKRQGRQRAAA
ncbi:MAG: hypothetical protein AB7G80_05995 [Dongiaceae bacterium]